MIYYTPSPREFEEIGAIRLACNARAPYLAREAITRWLGSSHAAREIVTLAVSELVTNAVKYADATGTGAGCEDITLKLSQDSVVLRLTVTDPGSNCSTPTRIPLQAPDLHAEHGRGLAIVETLSRGRWGSYRSPGSGCRHVWCHLDRHPTEAQLEELYCAPVAG
ncbi:ATP-binding protein [Nonomuraea turkmeniaca]|uniref:ATP-binding protein n=1 Tax=Nonomuraea turkmeniaca TaxID=103838 RepID=A0A5S4EUW1_9ACTN|nr:ATP-binding protein [Nonomuraea turkmeniaca]TMR04298.1 ATP-binding protein [Nonomuraea turkmeniaca]